MLETDYILISLTFDNELAIKEFCNYKGRQFTLEEMAKIVYVVQHSDDQTHCHVYWLASKPMAKRTLDKDKILEKIKGMNFHRLN